MPSCNFVVRTDASVVTGTGHVMRTLALAQALRERGMTVTFVVARCVDTLVKRLQDETFEVRLLADCEPGGPEDAVQTCAIAAAVEAGWIILDGYAFGHDYQQSCRRSGCRLVAVDDHQYCERWDVDVLLNQNLHAPPLRDAYQQASGHATLLLGTDFALMRKEFWRRPGSPTQRRTDKTQVLLTMGGTDPPNATGLLIQALALIQSVPLRVCVLVGAGNPHRHELETLCAKHPDRFELIGGVEQMSSLLEEADCIVTAGGSTCWEVLWAGKPGAVLIIAENQKPIADSLSGQRLMLSLGEYGGKSAEQLAGELEQWLKFQPAREASRRVDGKGARRVAAILDGSYSITLATAGEGWLKPHLETLKAGLESSGHRVRVACNPDEMTGGDFLFLLSYWGIVKPEVLDRYLHGLVVHASPLPEGRGWSPATWAVLEGRDRLPICLLEASEKVDRGDIYIRDEIGLEGHELLGEWRQSITSKTTALCLRFVREYADLLANRERQPEAGTYHPRRRPEDSELDMSKTLAELFPLLRVVDNAAYPAFFDHLGHRYVLKIEKMPS